MFEKGVYKSWNYNEERLGACEFRMARDKQEFRDRMGENSGSLLFVVATFALTI